MPDMTPSDVHAMRPLGADVGGRKKFAVKMDVEHASRKKQRKKKVKPIEYSPDWVEKMRVQKKFHSAKNRRALAAQGKALPNESYPIEDEDDLKNAATLARSGHGDVGAAKRLIARRSKQLGTQNPLASSSVGKSHSVITPISSHFFRLTERSNGA